MIVYRTKEKCNNITYQKIHFKYRNEHFVLHHTYDSNKYVTECIFKHQKLRRTIHIPKISYMYHTRCLNVQQHINNFIIELKEQVIWKK